MSHSDGITLFCLTKIILKQPPVVVIEKRLSQPRHRCFPVNFAKFLKTQKQPSRGVLRKRCSENMQQIYRRTPMPKWGFNKVPKHGCSSVNLLHISRTTFLKNTYGWLLLIIFSIADYVVSFLQFAPVFRKRKRNNLLSMLNVSWHFVYYCFQ